MKKKFQVFVDQFITDDVKQDPENYRRAILIVLYATLLIVLCSCLILFNLYYGIIWGLSADIIVIGISVGIIKLQRNPKNFSLISWIFFGIAISISYLTGHFSGGLYSHGTMMYPFAPVMGFWIGGRKMGLLQAILALLFAFFLVPIIESYVIAPQANPQAIILDLVFITTLLFIAIFMTVIMLLNNYSREELVRKIRYKDQLLIQQDKMASLGALTAGIAHEINNPLNFVNSNAHALKLDIEELQTLLEALSALKQQPNQTQTKVILDKIEQLDLDFLTQEIKQLVDSIERGANRTQTIVNGLRNFSHPSNNGYMFANLNEGLDSTLSILHTKIADRIQVHKSYGNIPEVACQFGKINQVFMNILNNAIQSIPEKGEIFIETRQVKDKVHILIRDTGSGIPEKSRKRIFDPFFTTKPIGQGTGLGLSISYGIVEQHNGQISLHSEMDKGSTFTIILPIKQE